LHLCFFFSSTIRFGVFASGIRFAKVIDFTKQNLIFGEIFYDLHKMLAFCGFRSTPSQKSVLGCLTYFMESQPFQLLHTLRVN
jgi:hypothetical protein